MTGAPGIDDNLSVLALSIRQPFAELILRGVKTVEYRSRPTRIVNEPFYIYAARPKGRKSEIRISKSETIPNPQMTNGELPTGLLVGTAVISRCTRSTGSGRGRTNGSYHWYLKNVKRLARPRKPKNMPQPVWFNPF